MCSCFPGVDCAGAGVEAGIWRGGTAAIASVTPPSKAVNHLNRPSYSSTAEVRTRVHAFAVFRPHETKPPGRCQTSRSSRFSRKAGETEIETGTGPPRARRWPRTRLRPPRQEAATLFSRVLHPVQLPIRRREHPAAVVVLPESGFWCIGFIQRFVCLLSIASSPLFSSFFLFEAFFLFGTLKYPGVAADLGRTNINTSVSFLHYDNDHPCFPHTPSTAPRRGCDTHLDHPTESGRISGWVDGGRRLTPTGASDGRGREEDKKRPASSRNRRG